MGGTKNKSPAQKEKSQDESKKGSSKKGKKGEKSEGGAPKAEISVILTEDQAMKALKGAKVITVQELARQTGVKVSAANSLLRSLAEKGSVKIVGGNSGHRIYQPVTA